MKNNPGIWLIVFLTLLSCQGDLTENYVPGSERLKARYATPEPGTYLKPMAHSLLKEVNRIIENPEDFKDPPQWIREVFVAPQKRLTDTVIRYHGLELPVRVYYPTTASLKGDQPVTLFIHGGGFVFGSVDEYHIMVSKLARITGQVFVSLEYRLAPENPFPAGLNDCFAALCWLQAHGREIGADPSRICVMGDSAGGNLATVLTLMCRDRGRPQPACQVLLYPGVTFRETPFASRVYFGLAEPRNYILDQEFMLSVKARYLTDPGDEGHPYVSPLEATLTPDLAPALVITAACDPLRDGGRRYAEKLSEAGIETIHREYSGMIHGFMSFHMILREAVDAMKYIRDYLNGKYTADSYIYDEVLSHDPESPPSDPENTQEEPAVHGPGDSGPGHRDHHLPRHHPVVCLAPEL